MSVVDGGLLERAVRCGVQVRVTEEQHLPLQEGAMQLRERLVDQPAQGDPGGLRGTPSAHELAHLPASFHDGHDGQSLGWRGYSVMTAG